MPTIADKTNIQVGTKVVRGRDWMWKNQDISSGYGTVTSHKGYFPLEKDTRWVKVKWENGGEYSYRVAEDRYDLYLYEEPIPFITFEKDTAYHAETEEEAIMLLTEAEKQGLEWSDGESFTKDVRWDRYKEETCYNIKNGQYSPVSWYKSGGVKIVEVKDLFKLTDTNKSQLGSWTKEQWLGKKVALLWEASKQKEIHSFFNDAMDREFEQFAGNYKYYTFADTDYARGSDDTDLPIVTIDNLTNKNQKEMKNKTIKGYKFKPGMEKYATAAAQIEGYEQVGNTNVKELIPLPEKQKTVDKLREAGVLDIWFDAVYEEDLKAGDWIIFTTLGAYKGDARYDGGAVQFKGFEGSQLKFINRKGDEDGINRNSWEFRKATSEEIKAATIITVAKYNAEFVGKDIVKFGCQTLNKEFLRSMKFLLSSSELEAQVTIRGEKITLGLVEKILARMKWPIEDIFS